MMQSFTLTFVLLLSGASISMIILCIYQNKKTHASVQCNENLIQETHASVQRNENLIQETIGGLNRSIVYFSSHIDEINFDAVFCTHVCNGQLKGFLRSPLAKKLSEKTLSLIVSIKDETEQIIKIAESRLKAEDPFFFSGLKLGYLLNLAEFDFWYDKRKVNKNLQVMPYTCDEMTAIGARMGLFSDGCMTEICENRAEIGACEISKYCWHYETMPKLASYDLTHQMLFFQVYEALDCFSINKKMKKIVDVLQDQFCADVLRDAEKMAEMDYPEIHIDLFLEQIGLCGMWGYEDFFNLQWLNAILDWQLPCGCFENKGNGICFDYTKYLRQNYPHGSKKDVKITENSTVFKGPVRRRVKRRDKLLEDGCSSHATGVALLAFMTQLRFCVENL